MNISFYTNNPNLDNKEFFTGYHDPRDLEEEFSELYNSALGFLKNKYRYSTLKTEILYGFYLKCLINMYISYSNIVNNTNQHSFKLFVPTNFFKNKEEFTDFGIYFHSAFFKTILFEYVALKKNKSVELVPLLTSIEPKSSFEAPKKIKSIFRYIAYNLIILTKLKFGHFKNVVGINYHSEISRRIAICPETINVKFDLLFFGVKSNRINYIKSTLDIELDDFIERTFRPWMFRNTLLFRLYLDFLGLRKCVNKLATDSYHINNFIFKSLVIERFEKRGLATAVISHGATFFLNPRSWLYLQSPAYKYYGNGFLNVEEGGIRIHPGYSGKAVRGLKTITRSKHAKTVIIYLYPHYQSFRKNNAEAISYLHFKDIELIVDSLLLFNFEVILKPHKNSQKSSVFYPDFINALKLKYPKLIITMNLPESTLDSSTIHLFTYLSTGWLEKIQEGLSSVCFNPGYLDLTVGRDVGILINKELMNRCYFDNHFDLQEYFKSTNFNVHCDIDGIWRYGDFKQYLSFIYELEK